MIALVVAPPLGRAERAVFAREIGEKGDACGGQAASARCRGAGSAGDPRAGQVAPARGAKGRAGGVADLARNRNRRARTGGSRWSAAREEEGAAAGWRVRAS